MPGQPALSGERGVSPARHDRRLRAPRSLLTRWSWARAWPNDDKGPISIAIAVPSLDLQLARTLLRFAGPVVATALGLLDRGATLDELVAVLDDADGQPNVTVGSRKQLLADVPELALVLSERQVPLGYLQWVAFMDKRVASGAFRVVLWARVEA